MSNEEHLIENAIMAIKKDHEEKTDENVKEFYDAWHNKEMAKSVGISLESVYSMAQYVYYDWILEKEQDDFYDKAKEMAEKEQNMKRTIDLNPREKSSLETCDAMIDIFFHGFSLKSDIFEKKGIGYFPVVGDKSTYIVAIDTIKGFTFAADIDYKSNNFGRQYMLNNIITTKYTIANEDKTIDDISIEVYDLGSSFGAICGKSDVMVILSDKEYGKVIGKISGKDAIGKAKKSMIDFMQYADALCGEIPNIKGVNINE